MHCISYDKTRCSLMTILIVPQNPSFLGGKIIELGSFVLSKKIFFRPNLSFLSKPRRLFTFPNLIQIFSNYEGTRCQTIVYKQTNFSLSLFDKNDGQKQWYCSPKWWILRSGRKVWVRLIILLAKQCTLAEFNLFFFAHSVLSWMKKGLSWRPRDRGQIIYA